MKPIDTAVAARTEELLIEGALHGLDAPAAAELQALGAAGDESYELAAAAIDLATLKDEAVPPEIAAKLLATAEHWSVGAASTRLPRRTRQRIPAAARGWLAAAMVAIVSAGLLWSTRSPQRPQTTPQIVYVPTKPTVLPPLTLAMERAKFLAENRDVQTIAWKATADEAARGASGDIVWSQAAQRGYMRFVGIAQNDKRKFQYQLWIFDKARDARYPVDGGVFDVSAAGELIVPITARLPIGKPTLFAVTAEKPGGVVVSDRKRIVVAASVT